MVQKKERNSNLELLRILAALFVIILHYNYPDGGKAFLHTQAMPQNYQILLIFEMLAICAVNIFVMISGYFLCTSTKVQVWKVIKLYIAVMFFSVLQYSLACLLGNNTFTVRRFLGHFIPANWYVSVYSGLYLISPYLNQILKGRTRSQFRFMLLLFFLILSVWPSGIEFFGEIIGFSPIALTPISRQGSNDGYTLINFILLYFIGAYFRLHEDDGPSAKKLRNGLVVYIACALLNTVYANFFLNHATSYCNPLVVIQTVAIFVVFQNIRIRSRAVNAIASCSFGVYLMHGFFYPFCQVEKHVTGNLWVIPIHAIVSVILIYAASALVYWVYQKLFTPVFAWLQRKLRFLSYDVA